MAVITVSRQFGCGGSAIALLAAQRLGYHFVDKDFISRVLMQYGFDEFETEYETIPNFWSRFDIRRAEMVQMLDRVMRTVARCGQVVILGRGSFAVLGGYADVLNVRIQAPLADRVARVMQRQQIPTPEMAEPVVLDNDQLRTTFLEAFYDIHWDMASAFDLVINTGKVTQEAAVSWMVEAAKALPQNRSSQALTTDSIQVDPHLAEVVASLLARQMVA
jgi:cytidylate kinase